MSSFQGYVSSFGAHNGLDDSRCSPREDLIAADLTDYINDKQPLESIEQSEFRKSVSIGVIYSHLPSPPPPSYVCLQTSFPSS